MKIITAPATWRTRGRWGQGPQGLKIILKNVQQTERDANAGGRFFYFFEKGKALQNGVRRA